MIDTELEALRYPIGRFSYQTASTREDLDLAIKTIALFPKKLANAVELLNDAQLSTEYRPSGWNLKQVVHHCADSHLNALTRFKLTLTEDKPIIKPYLEAEWALLADNELPISCSLAMLHSMHLKLVFLLESMTWADFERSYFHPEKNSYLSLAETTALYAWHGEHHLAHIKNTIKRLAW